MTDEKGTREYGRFSALNGTALLVQAVAVVAGLVWGLVHFQRSAQPVPVWYVITGGVGLTIGLVLLGAAIGTYWRRAKATHLAGIWYLMVAGVAALYAIIALFVVEELTARLLFSLAGACVAGLAFVLLLAVSRQIEGDNAHVARLFWYGARVEMTVLLALAALAMVNYAARLIYVRSDWTAAGTQKLSPRSTKLAEGLTKPVRLTSLYAVLEEVPESARLKENLERVKRLFNEYQRINPKRIEIQHINPIKDKEGVRELLARLKAAYEPEAKDHIELISQAISEDLGRFREVFNKERDQAEELRQIESKAGNRKMVDVLRQAVSGFDHSVAQADRTEQTLKAIVESDIPAYTDGTSAIRNLSEDVKNLLESAIKAYREALERFEGLSEQTRAFLQDGRKRLGKVLARCRELTSKVDNLESLESQSLLFNLRQSNPVVVETGAGAKVLSFNTIWPQVQTGPGRAATPRRTFAGEQKISSAILALSQEKKAVVVFVRWGGRASLGFRGHFSALAERLGEANFEVREWDVQKEDAPPVVEDMSRSIWVILPPQPGAPPAGMPFARPPQISSKDKMKIEHHLNSGGRALFMMSPSNAMLGPPSPFIPKLKEYGIEVSPEVVAMWGPQAPNGTVRAIDYVSINEYESGHPIVESLGAFPSVFIQAVPVKPVAAEGATSAALVRVKSGPDYWGETSFMAGSVARTWIKDEQDIPGGFAIAAAGQKGESKVVVVGDFRWAANEIIARRVGFMGLGGLQFPGNVLLFENAIFWLNDNEQMIAVPAQMLQMARIGTMSKAAMWTWRIVAMAGLPLVCLVIGGVVFMFRRA